VHELILWCGFFGAWLLVASPVYQAVLELQAENIESDRLRNLRTVVPEPAGTSPWWLLPPVYYVLERRRMTRHRQAIMDSLTDEDYESLTNYMNKATGWLFVGVGGLLIAAKETYELVHGLEWSLVIFWLLVLVMISASIGNAVARQSHTERVGAGRKG
jgi:hypothetical protein